MYLTSTILYTVLLKSTLSVHPKFKGVSLFQFLLRLKECIRVSIKNIRQEKKFPDKQFYQHQLTVYKVIIFLYEENSKITF